MDLSMILISAAVTIGSLFFLSIIKWILSLRRVVPTNEVHIVQTSKRTISYGKDTTDNAGNTYYEWPSWIPFIGITMVKLPVSVFDLDLESYAAYDRGRLPFILDIKAFFRVNDSNMAAARVESFDDLYSQLEGIVQGSVRTILAKAELESILSERSTYGAQFTEEVEEQLKQWGVVAVKNIELMDIRDSKESMVIANIMEKKKSEIEMESRIAVAGNIQRAEQAEIDAKREVDLQNENATQIVGLRKAQVQQDVGIANEKSAQEIKEQMRITTEKDMAIKQVTIIREAEIVKDQQVIKAEEERQRTVIIAEGELEAKKREAEGIQVEGTAKASAEKAMQLAPVEAQIVLAKEIGTNKEYQTYLLTLRQIEAAQAVGEEQAKALVSADVKVIANTGDVPQGMTKVMDLFTPQGGLSVGAALEALKSTPAGAAIMSNFMAPEPTK